MKKFFLYLVFLLGTSLTVSAQEICDNAIDDDGDGLIDLNDDECDCAGFGTEIESLIPNPSFEETDCCPSTWSELTCASTWIQASFPTSDYMNTCGWTGAFYDPPMYPLPGGGEAFVAFLNLPDWKEYIGACLDGPLVAGTAYTLKLYTAWGSGNTDLDLTIYGTPDCTDLPWAGNECPIGSGSWVELSSETVTYTTDGAWQEVEFTFVPAVNIEAVSIGSDCADPPPAGENDYYYLDELRLLDSASFDSGITEEGDWCDEDLVLTANSDSVGGTWQWYKDGIALIGETGETVNVADYGLGEYSAIYTIGDNCLRLDRFISDPESISADFEAPSACLGSPTDFTNTSVYGGAVTPEWEWDFGGDGTSTDENPSHTFSAPGTYTVELVALNDAGCNDTIEIDIEVDPIPEANFEFVIGGVSSQDGLPGGCIISPVQFNDLSTVDPPGEITGWSWDFGGDGTSSDENPVHTFSEAGTFTVELTVETENGCTATYEMDIIMTESLALDISVGEPTCFGFSDGSVTVDVIGASGDLTFEIRDAAGNLLNEDNSNTANTLPTGWYYFNVGDDTACDGIDSIFVGQPDQLEADITTFDVLCYGNETGWARVDTVRNWQGDYGQMAYFWAPNTSGVEGIGADSTFNMGEGTYTLTINDDNGCSRVYNFDIEEPDSLYLVEFGMDPAFCRLFDYQNGNGQVYGAATGGTPDYDYIWTDLQTGNTSPNSTWGGRNPGDYELTATDDNGCVITQVITVDSLNPEAIFTVTSDQLNEDCKGTAPVEAFFYNNSINYANPGNPERDTIGFWNFDTLTSSSWILTEDFEEVYDTMYLSRGQTYEVEVCLRVQNKNGCSDMACKTITIFEGIKFSDVNIFSPNGDGMNDEFTFEFKAASISEFTCIIVNRWGVVVKEISGINEGWDGTDMNGDPCSNGVYFYTYRAVTDNSNILEGQGNIQLVGIEE